MSAGSPAPPRDSGDAGSTRPAETAPVEGVPRPQGVAIRFELLDARIRLAVETVAGADPDPSDPYRGLYVSDDLALALSRFRSEGDIDSRLQAAGERLGLDGLETAVLGLCVAPELSPHYSRLYAYLHDDVMRKLATPRLVAHLIADDVITPARILDCFAKDGALRRTGAIRLLESGGPIPLAERLVKLGEPLAAFLLGSELDEATIDGGLRHLPLPNYDPGRAPVVEQLRAQLAYESRLPVVVAGPDAAVLVSVALGRPLLLANVAELAHADVMRDASLVCALTGSFLCFERIEELDPEARRRIADAARARSGRFVLCAKDRDAALALGEGTVVVVEVPAPSFGERRATWAGLSGSDDVADVAAKFRLSIEQIADATEVARLTAWSRGHETPTRDDLDRGAREASSRRLGELAARLQPAFGWDDLVLPERQLDVLKSISGYLRHRDLVLSEWGYERTAPNQGLKVLFAGESGTGKTMAGQVLARELGLELFRIDLATVVSKYIGETEKNLDHIFAAAEGSNAILFFDEADALFGKRSEVRDSHDRYANIEVAYLLQKMEGYAGAVILATNFRQNIDDAFLRRLDILVDFPFPEVDDRRRIWSLLLPETAPLDREDVDVDFLAQQFKLSGGSIRNCSLAAAFLAADDGGRIGMRHLVRAVALEYGKLGRLTLESDFERFYELIRPGNGGTSAQSTIGSSP